jgi:hypothetical protein
MSLGLCIGAYVVVMCCLARWHRPAGHAPVPWHEAWYRQQHRIAHEREIIEQTQTGDGIAHS